MVMRLSELATSQKGIISRVHGSGAFRKRIMEMGFIRGKNVEVIRNAPLLDPVEYRVMGYNVSLRRREAWLVEVIPGEEYRIETAPAVSAEESVFNRFPADRNRSEIRVALVGNPNSGKTSLFNRASGANERTGNYSGVTVDARESVIHHRGFTIRLTDLPGTYSLTEYSSEELFVRKQLLEGRPDIVINVVDASNLERNLYLTTQLIEMNVRVIIALNMYDELTKKGTRLDYSALGAMMGTPVIPTVAVKGKGIIELLDRTIQVFRGEDPVARPVRINYGSTVEASLDLIRKEIMIRGGAPEGISARYLAVRLLEGDRHATRFPEGNPGRPSPGEIAEIERNRLSKAYGEEVDVITADARYGFIAGALAETMSGSVSETAGRRRDPDYWLTHRIWGYPIFLVFLFIMFQTTFVAGGFPMRWIESGVSRLGILAGTLIPPGSLHDLVVDGIIAGVGGVIVFLPNILILFFFISLMEDTGYMARVSFIMDKLMHRIGLHGKSFIPLLMGFGCNVPAIMATRTLENRKDRIMTMLIAPFMSCSARLPVYILIISAFFEKSQGLVLFSVYLSGILLAVASALLLKKTIFAGKDVPFVMELPPYRVPSMRNTVRHMWFNAKQYLRKMGTVILVASVIIWALSYFPRLRGGTGVERLEHSFIGRTGHFIEPVVEPLGFDWKLGVSIVTGLAAKEVVVSTMGVLYHADENSGGDPVSLSRKLTEQKHTSGSLAGQEVFTPYVALGFMLFVLIYFPCIAVIAAIRKESSARWALFTMFYTTVLAWIVAFLVNQGGKLLFQ
jgi:ferrous iron transport protein B